MENLQVSDNVASITPRKGRGQYERKARGSYQKHKLEKKVSVKHYLNKKNSYQFHPVWDSDKTNEDRNRYELYVQITFNRKTTFVRSATKLLLSNEDFINMSSNISLNETINREKNYIQFHFKSVYTNYSSDLKYTYYSQTRHHLGLEKPTAEELEKIDEELEQESENTFDLKDIATHYSYDDFEIHKSVNYALKKVIFDFLEELSDKENKSIFERYDSIVPSLIFDFQEGYVRSNYDVKAIELLNYLIPNVPSIINLKEKYSSEIWNFSVYYCLLKTDNNYPYNILGATLYDFIKGDFEKVFLSKFENNDDVSSKIIYDMKNLFHLDFIFY